MKKFFESKRNQMLVAIVAAVIVLVSAVIVTVILARKKNTEPEKITPSTEAQTEAQTTTELQTEVSTEPSSPETTEASTKATETKKDTKSTKPGSKEPADKKPDNSGNKNTPVIDLGKVRLQGRWGISETLQPSDLFSAEFIEATGFNKGIGISTAYQFNSNNTFTITYQVHWSNDYESALRDAYQIYFKEVYPEWTEAENHKRADQEATRMRWEISRAFIGIENDVGQISGTYSYDDTKIYYKASDGTTFNETYVLQEDSLKLTGSSEGNEGYPITLSRWS